MKLLIRNLPRSTTETELLAMFEAVGIVQSCKIVLDKKSRTSKGFAFVEMPKPGDAKAACRILNGKELEGRKMRVKYAQSFEQSDVTSAGTETP